MTKIFIEAEFFLGGGGGERKKERKKNFLILSEFGIGLMQAHGIDFLPTLRGLIRVIIIGNGIS